MVKNFWQDRKKKYATNNKQSTNNNNNFGLPGMPSSVRGNNNSKQSFQKGVTKPKMSGRGLAGAAPKKKNLENLLADSIAKTDILSETMLACIRNNTQYGGKLTREELSAFRIARVAYRKSLGFPMKHSTRPDFRLTLGKMASFGGNNSNSAEHKFRHIKQETSEADCDKDVTSREEALKCLIDRLAPVIQPWDLQHLLLRCIEGVCSAYSTRWCQLYRYRYVSHVLYIQISGISNRDIYENPDCFPNLLNQFPADDEVTSSSRCSSIMNFRRANFKGPPFDPHFPHALTNELLYVPLAVSDDFKLLKACTNLTSHPARLMSGPSSSRIPFSTPSSSATTVNDNDDVYDEKPRKTAMGYVDTSKESFMVMKQLDGEAEVFSRTKLVLSHKQMRTFAIPFPRRKEKKPTENAKTESSDDEEKDSFPGFKFSRPGGYKPVTDESPMFGIDCEMCSTTRGTELSRVSIVDETGGILLDTLVRPANKVTSYLTHITGITQEKLDACETVLADVQHSMANLLPADGILVGHALRNDFQALKLFHPYVIDSSFVFNLSGFSGHQVKLQHAVSRFLGYTIQTSTAGHCSIEDALASLLLIRLKLRRGPSFGDMGRAASLTETIRKLKAAQNGEEVDEGSKIAPKSEALTILPGKGFKTVAPSKRTITPESTQEVEKTFFMFENQRYKSLFDSMHRFRLSGCMVTRTFEPSDKLVPRVDMEVHSCMPRDKDVLKQTKRALEQASIGTEKFIHDVPISSIEGAGSDVLKAALPAPAHPERPIRNFFTWAQFESPASLDPDSPDFSDAKRAAFKKVDARIGKLVHAAPDRALVIVSVSGGLVDRDPSNRELGSVFVGTVRKIESSCSRNAAPRELITTNNND